TKTPQTLFSNSNPTFSLLYSLNSLTSGLISTTEPTQLELQICLALHQRLHLLLAVLGFLEQQRIQWLVHGCGGGMKYEIEDFLRVMVGGGKYEMGDFFVVDVGGGKYEIQDFRG
ncbi:hypothetical protein DVH24_018297, partial [Malus domestica]